MSVEIEKFFESSSINGIKYFSRQFHFIERFFWLITLLTSLSLLFFVTVKLIIKVQNEPIIVLIQDNQASVSEINFPAVTVCPGFMEQLPSSKSLKIYSNDELRTYFNIKYEKHTKEIFKLEDKEYYEEFLDELRLKNFKYTEILQKIQSNVLKVEELGINILKRLQVVDSITQSGTFAKLNFSIPTDDFLDIINFFKKDELFEFTWRFSTRTGLSEILTEHGLCKTFNIALPTDLLNVNSTSEDFHFDLHYRTKLIQNITYTLPRSSMTSAQDLNFIAWAYEERKFGSRWKFDGFFVYLHDPYELPSRFSHTRISMNNTISEIFVEPQIIEIDDAIENDDFKDRNCYLANEYQLKLFKVYTKANCEAECLSNYMITLCGCVEFHMIRNKTTRICSANEKKCFKRAKSNFMKQIHQCKCLEPCYYVKYNFIDETKPENLGELKLPSNTEIKFKYRLNPVSKFIRKKRFDAVDFLSFVGGLLGLFAGFSVLSAVEIFYWFILRISTKNCNQRSNAVHPFTEDFIQVKKSNILEKFIKNSSIHGLSYLQDTNLVEKLFWTFFITLSITLCGLMVKDIHKNDWTIEIDDALNYKEKIPFPAVTIIPSLYVDKRFYEYTFQLIHFDYYKSLVLNTPHGRDDYLKNISRITQCNMNLDLQFPYHRAIAKSFNHIKAESQIEYFKQQFAIWNNKFQVKFAEIRTYFGMGFSFNMIDSEKLFKFKRVNDEFKYVKNILMLRQNSTLEIRTKAYPLKVDPKSHSIFKLKLKKPNLNFTIMKTCRENTIQIHSPKFSPTFMEKSDFAEISQSTNILVSLKIIKTDENLKSLKPIERNCYFQGEKKLKYFKIYSQKYCEMECIMDYMVNFCKCQKTNYVYEKKRKFEFCHGQKMYCGVHEERRFFDLYGIVLGHNCTCLPECNSVTYQTTFYPAEYFDDNETIITVQLNTDDLILYRKFQQFTFSDAVSYVGGLLGLFAGISMLSIVEIFYFFIWRVFGDFVKNFKNILI